MSENLEAAIDEIRVRFEPGIFPPEVRQWFAGPEAAQPWGVAYSGGPDSCLLLLLLLAHFPLRRNEIHVLHYNHGTRGEANNQEAALVAEVVERLGLRFHAGRRFGGETTEEAMRNDRHAFFHRVLAENGCRALFLGQQRDDIVESFLMRAARGSGIEGLCAPRPVVRHGAFIYLRPLLQLGAATIRGSLREIGVTYAEDASNRERIFLRNRLRMDVVPRWLDADPARDLRLGVARTRNLLEEDSEALREWAVRAWPLEATVESLPLDPLRTVPKAIARRILERWLALAGVLDSVSAGLSDSLLGMIRARETDRFSVGTDRWLAIREDAAQIVQREAAVPPWVEQSCGSKGSWALPGGAWLGTEVLDPPSEEIRDRIRKRLLEPAHEAVIEVAPKQALTFRNRRPGDRFHPMGGPGSRRLQDCLVDAKCPAEVRERLPVILRDGEVVWVPGFPPAESAKVDEGTKRALRLTYYIL